MSIRVIYHALENAQYAPLLLPQIVILLFKTAMLMMLNHPSFGFLDKHAFMLQDLGAYFLCPFLFFRRVSFVFGLES